MANFGINTNDTDFGLQANTFEGVVTAAMKTIGVNGLNANRNVGLMAIRKEGYRSPEGMSIMSSSAQSAQSMARSIVESLDFNGNPTHEVTGIDRKNFVMREEAVRSRAMRAAELGYSLGVGYQALETRELDNPTIGSGGVLMSPGSQGGYRSPAVRTEAFNNIDVKKSIAFSMGFNAAITRQTDLVMAWFPPIFINPDQTTLEISLNVLTVFGGAQHDISGKATDFQRRNIARAFEDPSILGRHETLMVPVVRNENADKFVDAAVIPPAVQEFGLRKVLTAPIKFDTDFNFLGLSTTDALLSVGASDHRDTVEPGSKLKAIYFKSGQDVIKLPLIGLKTGVFIGAQQGDQQETILNMRTRLAVGKMLKCYNGNDLTGPLKTIATSDLRLKLALQVGGLINIETGNGKVNKPSMALVALVSTGSGLEITEGPVLAALKDAVSKFEFLGFDVQGYRTNANRRQTGDRITTRRFNFHYVVPYRDPITAERPAHKQEEQDAQDLTNLLSLTRIRLELEAVDKIVERANVLETYVDMRDTDAEATDIDGLAQYYTIPTFTDVNLNLKDYVDSVTSFDRARDIQASFVTKLRDLASRLYTYSQFKAGTDVQSGGTLPKPQLNVLCDPIVARYILEPGELRTVGDFELILTTTLNRHVAGKMFISFRMPGQESSNEPCIFNFGHLIMSPELVVSANMTRKGSYFAETQVVPRYEFIFMNPIMARINVSGVKEVLSKIPRLTTLSGPVTIEDVVPVKP